MSAGLIEGRARIMDVEASSCSFIVAIELQAADFLLLSTSRIAAAFSNWASVRIVDVILQIAVHATITAAEQTAELMLLLLLVLVLFMRMQSFSIIVPTDILLFSLKMFYARNRLLILF
jgi:hypothetical protein